MMKEKNLLQSIICYFLNVENRENINDIFNECNKEIDKKIENGNYNFDINPIGIREIKKEGPFFIECKHIYCI
jgi:hypothetical protein